MTPTASALSPLSLIKHSAIWERRWFQIIVAGRSFPGEWPEVPDVESDELDATPFGLERGRKVPDAGTGALPA